MELPKVDISGSAPNSALVFNPKEAYDDRDIDFGVDLIYDFYRGFNEIEIRLNNVIEKTIFVLSQKGEMAEKLSLDHSVRSITVDESLGKIYGITTDEEAGIAVFDVPKG